MPFFSITVFTSAFLLFQVQPIVARFILPWYGGSPAVWTTCLLFFQAGLLAGYGYAHAVVSRFRNHRKTQIAIHLGLVAAAFLFLPITPGEAFRPEGADETSSVWGIVRILALTVGLPYVVISASGPLLQHWFVSARPGRPVYRLFAVSNFGSLLGLLSYPFLIEPLLGVSQQTLWWSGGFVAYASLVGVCARVFSRGSAAPSVDDSPEKALEASVAQRILWVLLAACGSAGMLAITNQMCQDVAVVPFLLVAPLSLYLVSFVICFDRAAWYRRRLWIPLAIVAVGTLVVLLNLQALESRPDHFLSSVFGHREPHIYWQLTIFLAGLFSLCMVCHGELYRLRPPEGNLTLFYLSISFGGVLGGVFVSLLTPVIFNGYWELHIVILSTVGLVGGVLCRTSLHPVKRRPSASCDEDTGYKPVLRPLTLSLVVFVLFAFGLIHHIRASRNNAIADTRSFHGTLQVIETNAGTEYHQRTLVHGRINHGMQFLDERYRRMPVSYFGENSGVGAVMQSIPERQPGENEPVDLGILGLGCGTLVTYAAPGDRVVIYEINPRVEQLARAHFSYLDDCRGEVTIVPGDARTSMENELARGQNRQFDVLILDAFSGDAVPMHLLTREAFDIYFRHLDEDGCLVAQITNRYLDLSDPLRHLAEDFGCEALWVSDRPAAGVIHLTASDWVVITRNREVIERIRDGGWLTNWERTTPKPIHWTDDRSNLFQVIR